MLTINNLFNKLENSNFEDTGGPLKNRVEFKVIKKLLYERLTEPVSEKFVGQFHLGAQSLDDKTNEIYLDQNEDD